MGHIYVYIYIASNPQKKEWLYEYIWYVQHDFRILLFYLFARRYENDMYSEREDYINDSMKREVKIVSKEKQVENHLLIRDTGYCIVVEGTLAKENPCQFISQSIWLEGLLVTSCDESSLWYLTSAVEMFPNVPKPHPLPDLPHNFSETSASFGGVLWVFPLIIPNFGGTPRDMT